MHPLILAKIIPFRTNNNILSSNLPFQIQHFDKDPTTFKHMC